MKVNDIILIISFINIIFDTVRIVEKTNNISKRYEFIMNLKKTKFMTDILISFSQINLFIY